MRASPHHKYTPQLSSINLLLQANGTVVTGVPLAYMPQWSSFNEWFKYDEQMSDPILLKCVRMPLLAYYFR